MNESGKFLNGDNEDVDFDNLYPALIECFTIILCGYIAGRLNLISSQEGKGLNVFVSSFSLPSLIFLSLAQLDLSSVNWSFLASILISKAVIFIGVVVITFFLCRPVHFGKLGIYAIFCTQSNDFAIGYPILSAIYNRNHPDYPAYLYLLAPISLAILNPLAFVLMELGKRRENINTGGTISLGENGVTPDQCSQNRTGSSNGDNNAVENIDSPASDRCPTREESHFKLFAAILKSIVCNPIIFMTILGLIGNSFFKYIGFATGILKVLGSAFSATALFVLGLRMVSSVRKFKGDDLVVSGILIIIKLLVFPLVTREVVSILKPGKNPDETLDLSTFGFLYGTFPTAPAVFVFSLQYNLEVDLISSSMVACTFISAPLMYVSARMTFLDNSVPENHFKELQNFKWDLGIVGVLVGSWMLVLFIINKSFSKLPQKATGYLVISQIIICIAVLLEPLNDRWKPWFVYAQFTAFIFGVFSSRIWGMLLAVILVVLQSRSLCYVLKFMPLFITLGWLIPAILSAVLCYKIEPGRSTSTNMNSPNFQFGFFEAAVTLVFLVICCLVTAASLIMQQRYRRRSAAYLSLVKEVNSRDLEEAPSSSEIDPERTISHPTSSTKVLDIEELVPNDRINQNTDCEPQSNCESELCSLRFNCTEEQREACEVNVKHYNDQVINEEAESDPADEQQILRHVILLILLLTSMFVGIMLCIWTLVVADMYSGIYLELAFLDVTLNIGQICLSFAVFGLDVRRIFLLIMKRFRRIIYGADTIILTPVDKLSFETTHVCNQFITHHLKNCKLSIAHNKRLRLKLYRDCFKGSDLVSWLQQKRLAKDTEEAVLYATHLLEGRVLRHVENAHHFVNSNLLYTFNN